MGDNDKTRTHLPKLDEDEVFEVGDASVVERPALGPPPSAGNSLLPWLLFGLTAASAAAATWSYVLPQKEELLHLQAQKVALQAEVGALKTRMEKSEAVAQELSDKAAALAEDVQKKDAALKELTSTKDELESKLKTEIAQGDVMVKQYKGELVVDLVDQILFASGEAELNDKGKAVLKQVGETLMKVPDKVLQIGGHTDNQAISPKLKAQFPSNWELSAARALNVVHYLQDEVKIPGERLLAAGFSEFRPAGKNSSKEGRKRNRRIEVTLLARR